MIDVVIPFHSTDLRDDMLKYCLRSLCDYFKANFRLVLFGEPVHFVEKALVKLYLAGEQTDGDEQELLLHICNDPDISDRFLFLHEWMFLIRPAMVSSFRTPVALCAAWESPGGEEFYALRNAGLKYREWYNYEAGVPVLYEKSKLLSVLDLTGQFSRYPACTSYHNFWHNGLPRMASDFTARLMGYDGAYSLSSADSMWVIQHLHNKMCISVNSDGFTPAVRSVLDQMFPEPCIFEKKH